ncbi:unnamed protein product [Effrenium voratum]|nr:unnamed protein product [Effrenium voratum]
MAGKRLERRLSDGSSFIMANAKRRGSVMGASPGTGLFVHEPRAKNRYSREVPKEDGGKSVADQEEEKINARLVEILERKVAKLRTKAEQEEQGRKVAEAELEELRPQFEQLQQEAAALRHAHRELSEDRQEAQRRNAELAGVQRPQLATRFLQRLRGERLVAAVDVLRSMGRAEVEVNVFHFTALVSACGASGRWRVGLHFLLTMGLREVCPNDITFTAAHNACAQAERWREALGLLQTMPEGQIRLDVFSCSAAVTACAQRSTWAAAVQVLTFMGCALVAANVLTFSAALSAYERSRQWRAGLHLAQDLGADLVAASTCISSLQKADRWEGAARLLFELPLSRLQPNAFSFNSVVSGESSRWQWPLTVLSDLDEVGCNAAASSCGERWGPALGILQHMGRSALQPDEVTYSAVITACEATQWRRGLALIWAMLRRRLRADGVAWSSAVSACERSSSWQAALALFESGRDGGFGDSVALGAVLRALRAAGAWRQALALLGAGGAGGAGADAVCGAEACGACCGGWKFQVAQRSRRCKTAMQSCRGCKIKVPELKNSKWKAQIVKLVEEMRKVEQRTATLAKELAASKAELAKLKAGGQDVVQRYEEESGRRLELEEKCLHLEEKLKCREQRSRDETAQKAKQSQASQANVAKLEERAKQQEEQNLEMARRMEEAEARCRAAEAELERLRAACAAKGRRVEELEAERCEEPPGRPPIPRSRPGTGSSVGSRHPGHDSRTQPLQSASESRLPPGAIRRGGSVPARRPQGLGSLSRSISPKAPQRSTFGAGIARVATSRPSSRGSRPGSAHQSEELEIDDAIPSDSEDSSDEEILTSVKTAA